MSISVNEKNDIAPICMYVSSFRQVLYFDTGNFRKNGKSLEESFLEIEVFDSDFKKMLVYALTSNQMHVFFDLYMKKCSLDLEKSVKKISTGIQLFSYISIGILVLIVYQIMMMPLNMLNQI